MAIDSVTPVVSASPSSRGATPAGETSRSGSGDQFAVLVDQMTDAEPARAEAGGTRSAASRGRRPVAGKGSSTASVPDDQDSPPASDDQQDMDRAVRAVPVWISGIADRQFDGPALSNSAGQRTIDGGQDATTDAGADSLASSGSVV